MKLKFEAEPKEAMRFELSFKGVRKDTYARAYMILLNHVRLWSHVYCHIENISWKKSILITCNAKYAEDVKEVLEEFEFRVGKGKIVKGTVIKREKVYVAEPKIVNDKRTNAYIDNIYKNENAGIVLVAPYLD